jgi:hypothetical protein
MTRLQSTALTLCAVLFAVFAAGCGGSSATPMPSGISDPAAIVSHSFAAMEAAGTFHVEGTIDGTVNASSLGSLIGMGSVGLEGTLNVSGSTLTGDVDMARPAAHITATFPRLFGVSVDGILADGYWYARLSTSNKYTKYNAVTSVFASPPPDGKLNFRDELKALEARLDAAGVKATLSGRETVDGRDVYHLVANVPDSVLNSKISMAGPGATSVGIVLAPVDCWVYVDTLQLARIRVQGSSATLGNLDLSMILTRYGESVTVNAPPADQVGG